VAVKYPAAIWKLQRNRWQRSAAQSGEATKHCSWRGGGGESGNGNGNACVGKKHKMRVSEVPFTD